MSFQHSGGNEFFVSLDSAAHNLTPKVCFATHVPRVLTIAQAKTLIAEIQAVLPKEKVELAAVKAPESAQNASEE